MMKEEVAEWVPFSSALALIELSAEFGYTTLIAIVAELLTAFN